MQVALVLYEFVFVFTINLPTDRQTNAPRNQQQQKRERQNKKKQLQGNKLWPHATVKFVAHSHESRTHIVTYVSVSCFEDDNNTNTIYNNHEDDNDNYKEDIHTHTHMEGWIDGCRHTERETIRRTEYKGGNY